MAMLPTPCKTMPIATPSRLITAMNILADSFNDNRSKGEGIGFTTPLVDGLRPIELGDHLLVAYEEGLEPQECRPLLYRTTLVRTVEYGMQRINALPVPESAET